MPGANPACVVADDEQRVEKGGARLAQGVMNHREQILVGGRAVSAGLAHEGIERRQLIAMSDEDFDADVDDVGDILARQRGVDERLGQQRLAGLVHRLHFQKLSHGRQVFAPGLRGIVALQHRAIRSRPGCRGNMLHDGLRHLARRHEVAQALKRLEQQNESQARGG